MSGSCEGWDSELSNNADYMYLQAHHSFSRIHPVQMSCRPIASTALFRERGTPPLGTYLLNVDFSICPPDKFDPSAMQNCNGLPSPGTCIRRQGLLCGIARVVRAYDHTASWDLPTKKIQMPIVSKMVSCVHLLLTEIASRRSDSVCSAFKGGIKEKIYKTLRHDTGNI